VRNPVGSEPATSGSVIAKHERTSRLRAGANIFLFVRAWSNQQQLSVARIRCRVANKRGAITDRPAISLINAGQ